VKHTSQPRREKTRRAGFTLMEVLLVMAILVIMGTLVVANFSGILGKSKEKNAKIQLQALGKALDLYQIDMNGYPEGSGPDPLQALQVNPGTDLGNTTNWGGPYLKKAIPADPWGNPYQYESSYDDMTNQQVYRIYSMGPNPESGSDDIEEWSNK